MENEVCCSSNLILGRLVLGLFEAVTVDDWRAHPTRACTRTPGFSLRLLTVSFDLFWVGGRCALLHSLRGDAIQWTGDA